MAASRTQFAPASPDDVRWIFLLMLGRGPSGASTIDALQRQTVLGGLRHASRSREFRERVLAPLLEGQQTPHEVRFSQPPAAFLDWLTDTLPLDEHDITRLRAVNRWDQLLRYVFTTPGIADLVLAEETRRLTNGRLEPAAVAPNEPAPAADEAASAVVAQPVPGDDPATEDDVARLLLVFHGRPRTRDAAADPSSDAVGRPMREALCQTLRAEPFDAVIGALISGEELPHERDLPRPSTALRRWLTAHVPLGDASVAALDGVRTWRMLLSTLIVDDRVREAATGEGGALGADYAAARLAAAAASIRGELDMVPRELSFDPERRVVSGTFTAKRVVSRLRALLRVEGVEATVSAQPVRAEADGTWRFEIPLPEGTPADERCVATVELVVGAVARSPVPAALRFAAPATVAAPVPPRALALVRVSRAGRVLTLEGVPDEARVTINDMPIVPIALSDNPRRSFYLAAATLADGTLHRVAVRDEAGARLFQDVELEIDGSGADDVTLDAAGRVTGYSTAALEASPDAVFALLDDGEVITTARPVPSQHPRVVHLPLACGFDFSLPDGCFDGGQHRLTVALQDGEDSTTVGTLAFRYDDAAFIRDVTGNQQDAERALARSVRGRRPDRLLRFLHSRTGGVSRETLLELLLAARIANPDLDKQGAAAAYAELWDDSSRSSDDAQRLLGLVGDGLLRGMDATERRQVIETGLKECVVDIAIRIWQLAPEHPQTSVRAARLLLSVNRAALAQTIVDAGLERTPEDIGLLAVKGRLHLGRAEWDDASELMRQVRVRQPHHSDALSAQVRVRQAAGDHVGAMAAATGGRGVCQQPGGAMLARVAFPLGWLGWARAALNPQSDGELLARLDAAERLQRPPVDDTLALFVVPPSTSTSGLKSTFDLFGERCVLATRLEDRQVDRAPAFGTWSLFVRDDLTINEPLRDALLDLRRTGTGAVRIVGSDGATLRGLMLRTAHVRNLADCDLDGADQRVRSTLRTATVVA